MPTLETSCEKGIGYVRKSMYGCIDKELLTSMHDTAICGIFMLKKCELKLGHMQMGILRKSEEWRACFMREG